MLPEIDGLNAKPFAEKIRQLVEATDFMFENTSMPVTISIGVATLDADSTDAAGAHQARRRAPLRGQGARPQPRLRVVASFQSPRPVCGQRGGPRGARTLFT